VIRAKTSRRGFTAVELVVVIAIISLLAALTAGAVFRTLRTQEISFTEKTISKLSSVLDLHWKTVIDAARKEYDGLPLQVRQNLLDLADNQTLGPQTPKPDPRRDDRARLLYIKFRLRQEFPTTLSMALRPSETPDPNIPGGVRFFVAPQVVPVPYQTLLGAMQLSGKPAYINAVVDLMAKNGISLAQLDARPVMSEQSSMMLLMALGQSRAGVAPSPPEEIVGTNFVGADVGLNGSPRYFVDSWGTPLQFYAFPAYPEVVSGQLQGPSTSDLEVTVSFQGRTKEEVMRTTSTDPQDPEGLLLPPFLNFKGWAPNVPLTVTLDKILHPQIVPTQAGGQTVLLRRLMPVIASAGPDKDIGAAVASRATANPYMMLPTAASFDNIYSYRLRAAGGRGD